MYSVVRFVPDSARGERVNVGLIVGSDMTGEWDIRRISNNRRAKALDDQELFSGFLQAADKIETIIDATNDGQLVPTSNTASEAWLWRLYEESANVLQLSEPAPIAVESIDQAFETLFDTLLVDPYVERQRYKDKRIALSRLRAAYASVGVKPIRDFVENPVLRGQHYHGKVDFAVANGRAVQLAQAWSFQLPNQEELAEKIRAWAWIIQDVRSEGGAITMDTGRVIEVPTGVDVAAVFVPPASEEQSRTLDEAEAAFARIGVRLVPVENAESKVAIEAKASLDAAHA